MNKILNSNKINQIIDIIRDIMIDNSNKNIIQTKDNSNKNKMKNKIQRKSIEKV